MTSLVACRLRVEFLLLLAMGICSSRCLAKPFAYVTNNESLTVSVIDTAYQHGGGYDPGWRIGPGGVAVTPNGSRVYVTHGGGPNFVSVIDTVTNTVLTTVTVGFQPTDVAITPNGAFAYVTNTDSVSVIETATNAVVATIAVMDFPRADCDYSRRQPRLCGPLFGGVSVINTATNTVVTTIPLGGHPLVAWRSPRMEVASMWRTGVHGVAVIDTATNTVVAEVALSGFPSQVAVVPNGTRAYVTTGNSSVSVIDTATNTLMATIPGFTSVGDVAITPDGRRAYVAQGHAHSVAVIDTATNTVVATVPVGISPVRVAMNFNTPSSFASSVFVPIVLSAAGLHDSFFTSEMTLTNKGSQNATVNFTYTSAIGSGSGTAVDLIEAGKQRVIPDAVSYLRSIGVPIANSVNQGGTLGVSFSGLSSPSDGAVTVRTTTAVPNGRAGMAYSGIPPGLALTFPSYLPGLRQNGTDRSNVALQNAGKSTDGDITLRLTVYSGDLTNVSQTLPDIVLPPGAFEQIVGILSSNGLSLTNGYVRVERISGTAPYYAYAVINDQFNSDGSFVPPRGEFSPRREGEFSLLARTKLMLPVLVEANTFSTEVVLTNWSDTIKRLQCSYVADAVQAPNSAANFTIEINPQEQLILPNFVQTLRDSEVSDVGPKGPPFVGAMFAEVVKGDLRGISLAARTSAPGGGGRYGLFYAGVPTDRASTTSVWIYGLQQNVENRSNLAFVNTGETDGSADVFRIDLFDGETGLKVSSLETTVNAKSWKQLGRVLADHAAGTRQGYARVTKIAGNNPFISYAVLNDGGQPGERTGDGTFVGSTP